MALSPKKTKKVNAHLFRELTARQAIHNDLHMWANTSTSNSKVRFLDDQWSSCKSNFFPLHLSLYSKAVRFRREFICLTPCNKGGLSLFCFCTLNGINLPSKVVQGWNADRTGWNRFKSTLLLNHCRQISQKTCFLYYDRSCAILHIPAMFWV